MVLLVHTVTYVTGGSFVYIVARNCNLMASCAFGTLGSSDDNPAKVQCVVVGICGKSIQGHLRNFRVFGNSALDCESKLMLARAGKRVHIACIYQAKRKVILIVVN